ncbi:MAG: hypothetical protein GXY32_04730 [Ruminococcaceae bacterium]|nr:hypothetical protein [Oscillospiraceae bacterium]
MQTPEKLIPYFSPRLMNALAGIRTSPATVVSAPSGLGKTTAVKHFLSIRQAQGSRVLWHTVLGESPDTAWRHICEMLSEVDAETAALLLQMGFPVRETLVLLAKLSARLRCAQETILVVDNTQIFEAEVSYELVMALAQHGNPLYHVVLITQTPLDSPVFPLGAPEVLFLGADNFFFQEEDIAAYFRLNGAELTQPQAHQVMKNTFGWVAVVRLQLLSYFQTGDIQLESRMSQLMRTALWEPLTAEEKYFLLAISRMDSLTRRQICILLNSDTVPAYGMKLLERGGFIQPDIQHHTYTVHSLLQNFLAPYFEELPPKEQKLLYARTGRAYLQADMPFPAFRMLMLSGAYAEMLQVPLANMDMAEHSTDEVVPLLQDVLAACPPELLKQHPVALLRFAFEALLRGARPLFSGYCALIEQVLNTPDALSPKSRQYLLGEYTFLCSFSYGNDLGKMHAAHKAALEALGGPSSAFDTRWSWTFDVPSTLAPYWSDRAPLAETLAAADDGMPTYLILSLGHATGATELMHAEALLNAGKLDEAEAMCHQARYLAGEHCQDSVCFGVELTRGRIAILRGDAAYYGARLESIDRLMLTGSEKMRHLLADQSTTFLQLALGRTEGVPTWLQSETTIRQRMFGDGTSYGMILLGKTLLLKKDYNRLLGLAGPVLQAAESQHLQLTQVYYLLYLACIKRATGAPAEAQQHLQRALDIALPNAVYLPFAEHSAELAQPLTVWEHTRNAGKHAATIRQLGKLQRAGAERINRKLYSTGVSLTPREAEIARYTKQGLSNKQIAEILFVSPETVKKTLKSVFLKLGLKSRTQLEDYTLK